MKTRPGWFRRSLRIPAAKVCGCAVSPRSGVRFLMRAALTVCSILTALVPGCPGRALTADLAPEGQVQFQAEPRQTAAERRLNIDSFEHLWKTVNEKHFDPTFGGLDWKEVRLEFLPKIEAAANKNEARAVMRDMLARMKLTHFSIIPSELYEDMSPTGHGTETLGVTGITARVIGGHALVTSVDAESPAEQAEVKPGWEIIQIANHEVRPRMASIAGQFEGKTLKDLVLADAVAGRLEGNIGERIEVSFLDDSDRTVERSLTFMEPRGTKFQIGNLPPGRLRFHTRTIGTDIGYIVFNAFIAPAILMPPFNEAMKSFMGAAGIIIDVRGNTGGQGDIVAGMAGWLIREKGKDLGKIQTRDQELKLVVRPRPEVFGGRVAILVDGLSLCATEVFADGLRELGRARIFGTRTGGAVLSGSIEKLPNGDGFMYPLANFVTARGRILEGNGLAPDVEVNHTREALLQGRDTVLEAAIDWIRSRQ